MPIIIPTPLIDMPVPAFRVDAASGSSGQTNQILNKTLNCFLYYDAGGAPNCGLNVGNGQQGSWSINDLNECSKRARASFSSKYLVANVPATPGTPGPAEIDRIEFLAEWLGVLTAFYTNADALGTASGAAPVLPGGYVSDGRSATRTVGLKTYTINLSTGLKDICVSPNPNAPSCELDAIVKAGVSFSASMKLPAPTCTQVSLGNATAKFTLYRGVYETGDAALMGAELLTNITVNP
jgi:hypothetical protein